jgi:hypothetical protein
VCGFQHGHGHGGVPCQHGHEAGRAGLFSDRAFSYRARAGPFKSARLAIYTFGFHAKAKTSNKQIFFILEVTLEKRMSKFMTPN